MNQPPRVFLRAQWRSLLMLNYPIEAEVLRPLVPVGTELDLWNGEAYVSMVGFHFLETRVMGCKIPFHVNFDEINLRFYVRRNEAGKWKRGVVFVKEIVPKWAIAFVARTLYNEKYVALKMRSEVFLPEAGQPGRVEYSWKQAGKWHSLRANIAGEPTLAATDSEGYFITEHYWGYTRLKDGSTMEYQVEHVPWRLWNASDAEFDCDVATVYGEQFARALSARPSSALVAEGSEVLVRKGTRLYGDDSAMPESVSH